MDSKSDFWVVLTWKEINISLPLMFNLEIRPLFLIIIWISEQQEVQKINFKLEYGNDPMI